MKPVRNSLSNIAISDVAHLLGDLEAAHEPADDQAADDALCDLLRLQEQLACAPHGREAVIGGRFGKGGIRNTAALCSMEDPCTQSFDLTSGTLDAGTAAADGQV